MEFKIAQLPIVKIHKFSDFIPRTNLLRTTSATLELIETSETTTISDDKQPSGSEKIPHQETEEMLTWPGSCETSSPIDSPTENITTEIAPSKNLSDLPELETQSDSNILDPTFIEKLGEEISFLNQPSTSVEITSAIPDSLPGNFIDGVVRTNSAVPSTNISGESDH